ncbi:MAG: aldehyde dehydrogenase [Lachnospiraceae bacterium]|jgi:aldehyde dehydrogenase (NAD+)
MRIKETIEKQRAFYESGTTRTYEYRLRALKNLEKAIRQMEPEINEALHKDLNKAPTESYMTEVGMVLSELRYAKKHLKKWMKKDRVRTPLAQFPSKSFTIAEPYGVVLIMAPWNYPFMLSIEPLIGAIAAGNCVVLKPSAYAKATGDVLEKLIHMIFPKEFVTIVKGGREENAILLDIRFDYIFFTGSVSVGKLVMEKASKNLTPVSLELGGKSPCIIDETADLNLAAKRLVFGKFLNCGQTCVAPDYVLVQESVKDELVEKLSVWIHKFYGNDPLECAEYPKMINEKHFERVCGLMQSGKIVIGGQTNPDTLQIEPTVLCDVKRDDPVMEEEIFGPVLPLITYRTKSDLLSYIRSYEKPLALYLFTRKRKMQCWVLSNISFGGGCINDTVIHLATPYMAFGGVGASGMGSYHGKQSFETFSHRRSIVKKGLWLDLPMRYHPYTKTKDKLVRMFVK